jgi:hypothetical protein
MKQMKKIKKVAKKAKKRMTFGKLRKKMYGLSRQEDMGKI